MTSTRSPGVIKRIVVTAFSCKPPSLPIVTNGCPSRSRKKKRLFAVLTMRQRCGAPDRARSFGMILPLTSTYAPSRPNTIPAGPPLSADSRGAASVEADIAEHQRQLIGNARRLADPRRERAVKAKAHLRRRHHVRVIPVQTRVAQREVIGE